MEGHDLSTLDPQARRFLTMVAVAARSGDTVGLAERRRSFEQLMRFSLAPVAPVTTTDGVIPRCDGVIPIRVYAPAVGGMSRPGLVYFHGGGLVAGGLETHDNLCRSLAHHADCNIVAVDYRLAPEHPFPAAIIDAIVAVRWIARNRASLGLAGMGIAVGGDSGGATLATIVAGLLRRRGIIRAQVLLCPVLELAAKTESKHAFGSGFLLDTATMDQDLRHYAPGRPVRDPRVSPLREPDLAGMPPAIIHTAGFDPLRDEGAAYAARLESAGVAVRHTCHQALVHHFYCLDALIPAARAALSDIAADLRAVLR